MVISSDHRQESDLHRRSGQFVTTPSNLNEPEDVLKTPHALSGGFTVGAGDFQSGERSSRSKSYHKSRASWTRRNQNKRRISLADHGEAHVDREDGTALLAGITYCLYSEDVRRDCSVSAETSLPLDSLDDLEKQEHDPVC
ncbi:hypothetical protein F2Q69_00030376 [Brassica cretica]|uniref:Uncharacterized protein n=1 Tax=Brassica cretica TaxID=69181 RepID=A0A8S9S3R2_BRACR|nr:hypothetical protein F2Q69_00030376 [Brassica cretica]